MHIYNPEPKAERPAKIEYEWGPDNFWKGMLDCDLDTKLGTLTAFIRSLPINWNQRWEHGYSAYFCKAPYPTDWIAQEGWEKASYDAWQEHKEMMRADTYGEEY